MEEIRTYKNLKNNEFVEGNFSIFERWCGSTVEINGETPKELSKAIGEAMVGIFTQLRNHQPRRGTTTRITQ